MYKTVKSVLDILAAFIILLFLFPLLILITAILYCQNSGQPFFRQERPGYLERPFLVIKFKSMADKRDVAGNLLPDNERMTKFGIFLRKTSIDELPQLYNVLKGEMSIVGPRPLLFKYLPLYSENQRRRHDVKPGITGWAQVNGRNSISWTKKLEYDVYYVDHQSFAFDIKILWMTVLKVLRREGINQSPERPMQPFNGRN
ncbi:MAG: lipid carrier--UDP-N-acetylgalactosaminyltransferase [Candidatus Brocadia sp. WS118]|nr:MAG: lipid carrier--UDP-N-acetylgalactosaminyltransferase [Candidatus Brocadia sp. WS118]